MGANPTRQLSLQPEATEAVTQGEAAEAFGAEGPGKGLGDHAGRNVSERRAGLEKNNAEADPAKLRGRLPSLGKRAKRAPKGSAGVVAMACVEEEGRATREAHRVGEREAQPVAREGEAGPDEVTEGRVVLMKPGNAGGGKPPWFRVSARQSEGVGDWAT